MFLTISPAAFFYQVSLKIFCDYKIHQQYCMDILGEMAAKGLDDTQLGLWLIDVYDSMNIPAMLHKLPVMLQTTTYSCCTKSQ